MYFPDHGYGLHRVLYLSRSIDGAPMDDAAIAELVARSAVHNRARAITGALLVWDGWFVQVLEGSRDVVKPLYDRIAADPRHTGVTLRSVDPAATRAFGRWGMKRGAVPAGGVGFDIANALDQDLHALLRLSVLGAAAKAA